MIGRYSSVLLMAVALSCNRQAPQPTPVAASSVAVASAHAEEGHDEGQKSHSGKTKGKANKDKGAAHQAGGEGGRFSVPFVWETSKTDPLAVARDHLREILADNARYVKEHPRPRVPQPGEQRPSTTLVTCSDSAVQVPVLDATPENDMYVVRNMGNQLATSLPSVAYGIEVLKTPVLLIVGHTGCDAMHLSGGDGGATGKSLKRELARIPQTKPRKLSKGDAATQAVFENVHSQVEAAIAQFQSLVHTSKLTIVGAVYDPGNELRGGAGKLHIINVNSNRDPASMNAFVAAISSDNKIIRLDPEAAHEEHEESGTEEEAEDEPQEESHAGQSPRPTPIARRAQTDRHTSVHAAVIPDSHEATRDKNAKESVGLELDQLEAATRENAGRSKSPAVDLSIIEASLVDHN
jgi:carbonic anhydrase